MMDDRPVGRCLAGLFLWKKHRNCDRIYFGFLYTFDNDEQMCIYKSVFWDTFFGRVVLSRNVWRCIMYHPIKKSDMLQLVEYQEKLRKKPKLRYLFLELTDRCNLNCKHCGSRCTGNNDTYLEFDIIEKTLERVAMKYNPSEIMICITGGEPFLHPDIYKIIYLSRSLGFSVGITSNGTLIGEKQAKLLKQAGLNTITISIDGIGDVHNAFRCSAYAFDNAIIGCKNLKKAGIEPQALTVVHKNNLHQLEEIFEFLSQENFYSWRLVNMDPIGRAALQSQLLLDGKDLRILFDFIRDKRFDPDNKMEVTYGCSHFATMEYENEIRDFYFQCGAGTMVASIMANGNIGACLDIERRDDLVQGNIYFDDFIDVWENRYLIFRTNRATKSKKCSECEYGSVCQGDSAHTWDYDNNEPMYCVAKKVMEV